MNSPICMLTRALCVAAAFTASAGLLAQPATDSKTASPARSEAPPADHKHMAEEPGPEHAALMKLAGEYEVVNTFSMGPDTPTTQSKSNATFTAVLGSRFLQEDSKGEMMGVPFSGLKLWGFNAQSGKHESLWTYTGSTAMMTMTGAASADGKSVTFEAGYDTADGRDKFNITRTILDADHFKVEMKHNNPDGSVGGSFTATYARKK